MESSENISYVINMLKQISQTTSVISQNQTLLFEQYKTLDRKIDDNYAKLDKKIDDNYAKLDKKIDDNYAKLDKRIVNIQKDIKDLRTDIDTVYDLERDSRERIRHLL